MRGEESDKQYSWTAIRHPVLPPQAPRTQNFILRLRILRTLQTMIRSPLPMTFFLTVSCAVGLMVELCR